VSDFGLAKDLGDPDGELTIAGFALGTVGYMAPELLDGDREHLGPWTDVFALGAVLHELMAAELPFAGNTIIEASRAIREDAVRPIPNASAPVRELVKRALAKLPGERFPDAGELAAAIADARRQL
jgi:serine/threonine-protein kinase